MNPGSTSQEHVSMNWKVGASWPRMAGVAGLVALMAGASPMASADETVYACVKSNGKFDAVTTGTAPTCKNNETLISWNQTGPQGDTGPEGPEGPAGPGALWANVDSNGQVRAGTAGVSATQVRTGVYRVSFPREVTGCAMSLSPAQYLGSGIIAINPDVIDPPALSHVFLSAYGDLTMSGSMVVGVRGTNGALVSGPFSILFVCP